MYIEESDIVNMKANEHANSIWDVWYDTDNKTIITYLWID